MLTVKKNSFLFEKIDTLKGIGKQLSSYLRKKKIEKVKDLIFTFPYSSTDRTNQTKLDSLRIGSICTITVNVKRYNFPRIKNLPNRVYCEDETGKIEIIFFNSRENYIKKVLPLNQKVVISGKVGFYKKKYQITNPDYISKIENLDYIKKVIPKYSLTDGINEKVYRKIMEDVLKRLQEFDEWYDNELLTKQRFLSWRESIIKIHKAENKNFTKSIYFKRLAFDEILANLIVLSNNRKTLKKQKKTPKVFQFTKSSFLKKNLQFKLTNSQLKVIDEINDDLRSKFKMFRVLQGDVGSGKTIVALLTVLNVIEDGYQCAFMSPTEILATQHYNYTKKLFEKFDISISIITGKTKLSEKKKIQSLLLKGKIHIIFGTHSLFQTSINFKNLGYIIIDEQHRFGVKQRMLLSEKGGINCDTLLMSATPIPRTLMLTSYGDMDISIINEKPSMRKKILTLSKPEKKINEIYSFLKKNTQKGSQAFWVCPLIEESKKLNYASVKKRFEEIKNRINIRVALIHGLIKKEEKDKILNKFLKKEIDLIVSTTVIEVGIDFPNANLIIIENAEKFGLAQLHQLRGRVGRGNLQSYCILMFKKTLSLNATKRLKILKKSDNGFYIADQDLRLRGFGDIIGYQQSGEKYFKIANPSVHEDLFKNAENYMRKIENENLPLIKYNELLKIFDKVEIIL